MIAKNRAGWSLLGLILGLLVVQPGQAHAYDQATWDDLTKKEEPFLRTLRARPLELPAKGKVTQKVVCYFDSKYTYGVYVPKDYDPRKPWPVVFFTAPAANGWQYCMFYQMYAEQLGWIIACGNEASNVSTTSTLENNICVVKDVLARFNVHKEMCITAGFSTGGRIAGLMTMADKDYPWMMGSIQMGAAKGPLAPIGGKQIYLIGGRYDPNLAEVQDWDKACRKAGCQVEKVEWNVGHQMPSGPMFYQALQWQTNTFLRHSPDTSDATQQKRQDYVQDLIDIARRGDAGAKVVEIYVRYRDAYEAGTSIPCGLKMTKAAMALERRMGELARYPDVKKEVDCYTELQELIERVKVTEAAKAQKGADAAAPAEKPADGAAPAPDPAIAPAAPVEQPPMMEPPREGDAPPPPVKPAEPPPAATPAPADDDELIPAGDDLLPEELAKRKAAAKAEADAAAAKAKAEAEAKKKAEEAAKLAQVPPWEAAMALAKKYPGTPSALRAQQLAVEWQQLYQAVKLNKLQIQAFGQMILPPMDPVTTTGEKGQPQGFLPTTTEKEK